MLQLINRILITSSIEIGSLQQILPIGIAVLFSVVLVLYAKKKLAKKEQEKVLHGLAVFISLTVAAFHIYKIGLGSYQIQTDLPLYLCSLLGLIIPVFTYYKRNWMYEILLFWVIAGTTQAIVTPDISVGFPSFEYFRYWIVHLGLVVLILYATIVLKYKPTLKSVFKSFLALQVYIILMMCTNFFLDANYSYLNRKPESASILDYFGDWPIYIITVQLLLIPYFLIIYFGYYLIRKKI